jgi:hypothetical protein
MSATLDDLREALLEAADEALCRDPSTTVEEVGHAVAVADRRRRVGLAAAAACVIAVGGGLLAWDRGRDDAGPVPPATVVSDDSAFPAYDRGLKRLTIVDLPLSGDAEAVISTRERTQNRLFVVAYCQGTGGTGPMLSVRSADRQKFVPCLSRTQAESATSRPVLWRPADADVELVVEPARMARGTGRARVAVYQEVAWGDYRFPPRPHDLETNPHTAWPTTTGSEVWTGPADPARPNEPLTVTVTPHRYLLIRLHARAPGELRVTVDGTPVTLRCIGAAGPVACDSASSDSFTQWGYGRAEAGRWIDLDTEATTLRSGRPATVTVHPTWFASDDWRLEVSTPKR